MLRTVTRVSAGAGLASLALLLGLLLGPVVPERAAWGLAYSIVGLGMASAAGFAWVALTLPPGAPARTSVLKGGAIVVAALSVFVARGLA